MLHLLPHRIKQLVPLQMMLILTFFIIGCIIFPFIIIAYLILYKTHRLLYRAVVNRLCYIVWIHFTYIAQWWSGLRLRIFCDKTSIDKIGKEHALIIMNHKYDIDWVTTWLFAERFGVLGGGQSFAKNSLKYVPVFGWLWQFNGTIFLNRDYSKDKELIKEKLKGFNESLNGYYHVLLIYPEGTRFTLEKREASNEVARSKGMQELKHCLLPRTKGFVDVINSLRSQVDVIYNLTVGFPDSVKHTVQGVNYNQPGFTMQNILAAKVKEGNLHCERILMKTLPETDKELGLWLHDLFIKKDNLFEQYINTGKFEGPYMTIEPPLIGLLINCVTFTLIWGFIGNYLYCIFCMSSWMIRSIVLAVILTVFVIIQLMLSITQAEKGSSYGSKSH